MSSRETVGGGELAQKNKRIQNAWWDGDLGAARREQAALDGAKQAGGPKTEEQKRMWRDLWASGRIMRSGEEADVVKARLRLAALDDATEKRLVDGGDHVEFLRLSVLLYQLSTQ